MVTGRRRASDSTVWTDPRARALGSVQEAEGGGRFRYRLRMAGSRELSLAERVCLAVIAAGNEHGWAVGNELAPDGPVGRVWTLSRPLTYRALDGLLAAKLLRQTGSERGRGRDRRVLALTAAGRRALDAWLDAPVEHVRDVRTELLLKLTLGARLGRDGSELLARQQQQLAPLLDALIDAGEHPERSNDPVDLWRAENARAVRRFLDRAGGHGPPPRSAPTPLRISARNQLAAVVTAITRGEVMATVAVQLANDDGAEPQRMTAAITVAAVEDLDLAPGDEVVVVVKSTEVLIAKR